MDITDWLRGLSKRRKTAFGEAGLDGCRYDEAAAEISGLRTELASRQIDVETFSEANRHLRAELASVRLTLDQVSVEGAADRAELVAMNKRWTDAEYELRAAARQDADTIEAQRRTLDSVRSDRDESDAEIRRLKARSAEEMARLTGAIGRAVLAVTVSGLTVEGYKNACAQARDLLSAALACRPQGERSET